MILDGRSVLGSEEVSASRLLLGGGGSMNDKSKEAFDLPGGLGHVKLGAGVLGRTSPIILVLLGVLGVVAWRLDPSLLLWLALIASVVVLLYCTGAFLFALRNPQAALLEGAHLVESLNSVRPKEQPLTIEWAQQVPVANTATPSISHSTRDDDA
jgi:hypothetical protein